MLVALARVVCDPTSAQVFRKLSAYSNNNIYSVSSLQQIYLLQHTMFVIFCEIKFFNFAF